MTIGKTVKNKVLRAPVKWFNIYQPKEPVTQLSNKHVVFYDKCLIGDLSITLGDYVLVSNSDSGEPETVRGCDVAKVLYLYELCKNSKSDTCRALVQWYSRPEFIPHRMFDSVDLNIDFNQEVIEDNRPYDSDISLESVFRRCSIVYGPPESKAFHLLFGMKNTGCPMFVCRYKFIRVKSRYRIFPYNLAVANDRADDMANEKRRRLSIISKNKTENKNKAILTNSYKVSPIKIIGGRSVVRMSGSKVHTSTIRRSQSSNSTSPLMETNFEVSPKIRLLPARRNLNLSLDKTPDVSNETDLVNYSIVQQEEATSDNEVKITLRISESQKSLPSEEKLRTSFTYETENIPCADIAIKKLSTNGDFFSDKKCSIMLHFFRLHFFWCSFVN